MIEEALDRIRFQWESSEEFWFGMVVSNDQTARDALRSAVAAAVTASGGTIHTRRLDPHAVENTAVELLAAMEDGGLHWVVVGGADEPKETWEGAAGRFFAALNERREAFRHRILGGLVVEGREGLKRRLRTMAPDLFSIRAFVVEPRSDAGWDEGGGSSPIIELQDERFPGDPDQELERLERIPPGTSPNRGARRARLAAQQRAIDGLLSSGRIGEASTLVDDSTELIQTLTDDDPDDPWVASARFLSHIQRGRVALDTGVPGAALAQFEDALALAEGEPSSSRGLRRMGTAHDWLAAVALDLGDIDDAVTHATSALESARQWTAEAPADGERLRTLAIAHNKQGDVLVLAGRRRDARAAFRASLVIRKRLVAEDAPHPVFRRDLSICHDKLGDLAALNGDLADAERHFRRSLALREDLAAERPSGERAGAKARRDLASVHARLGGLARRAGDAGAAARALRQAAGILRELGQSDPQHAGVKADMVGVLGALGELARERSDPGKALVHFDESLRLAGELAAADWTRVTRLHTLGLAHERLGELLWAMEDFEESGTQLRAALDVRKRIVGVRPDDPAAAEDLAHAHERSQSAAESFGKEEEASRHREAALQERGRADQLRGKASGGTSS